MAKDFAPRISKKERKKVDLTNVLKRDLLDMANKGLLKDAKLMDLELRDIIVVEQVRTKFNESSLKELSENIKVNGLIQPLVVHKERTGYKLICGERRFRAMGLIKKKIAPCFILESKSENELMAIQFSENSSREELHFIDKADGIFNYKIATNASERKIVDALSTSKTEVHRCLLIAKLPQNIKESAKLHNIEKYVLLEFGEIQDKKIKNKISKKILNGDITKRTHLKKELKDLLSATNLSSINKSIKETKSKSKIKTKEKTNKKVTPVKISKINAKETKKVTKKVTKKKVSRKKDNANDLLLQKIKEQMSTKKNKLDKKTLSAIEQLIS
jgi:ParB family transcriptional regulator, chromosome partitioning protein